MALYQDYRPKDFHSLFGQTFIREVLQNALRLNRTVGAYLFHGSRGTGKTTVARILAKGVNCLSLTSDGNPCAKCQNCIDFEEGRLLDIIEIDAASNTGVDNIRDMIERAQFQPTQAPYKVYIIDEVHMLSKGAFNALLKTLEEPPKHVKFILATTEIHKIPDTIISRTQRYDFKRIKNEDIIERLRFIAHTEKIDAEESALELISRLAKGGLRDAITLLEQYSVGGVLKKRYIEENLELIGEDFLENFIHGILENNVPKTLSNLSFLREKGVDMKLFLEQLLVFLRDRMIESLSKGVSNQYSRLFDVFEIAYGKLKFVPDTFLLLETSVFRLVSSENISQEANVSEKVESKSKGFSAVSHNSDPSSKKEREKPTSSSENFPEKKSSGVKKEVNIEGVNVPKSGPTIAFDFVQFIEHIRTLPKRGFVALGLRSSTYEIGIDNSIVIYPDNDFNYQKLDTADIKGFLQEILDTLFGPGYSINIQRGKSTKKSISLVDEAKDIF